MTPLAIVFVCIIGILIGSYINVIIFRYEKESTLKGRSKCMSCKKTLKWYHLIPVVSFIFLKGKCGFCKTSLSLQYPLVEIASGLLFVAGAWAHVGYYFSNLVAFIVLLTLFLVIQSLMLAIVVYDLKYKIIPDPWVFLLIDVSFVYGLFFLVYHSFGISESLLHFSTGAILFSVIFSLWFFSKGKLIGLGDAKLFLAVGFLLGITKGISAFFLAFWIGAVVAIALLLMSPLNKFLKRITIKSEIPFAPFIVIAALLVFYFDLDFFDLLLHATY